MFNLDKFLANPKTEILTLRYAKKQELLSVAKHCKLAIEPTHVKARIINDILQYLIQQKAIDDDDEDVEDLRSYTGAHSVRVDPEVEKLKLQMQLLQLQRQAEVEKVQVEEKRLQIQSKAEEEKLVREREHQQMLDELEIQKETRKAALQLQTKKDEKQLPVSFDPLKAIKLLPEFNELDPEVFFELFEDTASTLRWPKDQWILLIRNNLKGKASYVVSQLISNKDYDFVKKAILDAYSITTEGYRQNFRNSFKNASQTFVEFCELKMRQLNKWIGKAGVNDFDSFKNLILLEELVRKVPLNVATHIMDKGETDALKAASIADDYSLIHRNKPNYHKSIPSHKYSPQVCTYCKKEGHDIQHCPSPHCKKSEQVKSVKSTTAQPNTKGNLSQQKTLHVAAVKQMDEPFQAFTCSGLLNDVPVKFLRDTGSTQTIVSVPGNQQMDLTNEYITVSDLTTSTTFPLAKVRLNCPYFEGDAVVAVTNKELPCSSVQVILGNDLAGTKVLNKNLIISDPKVIIGEDNNMLDNNTIEITQVATRSNQKEKIEQQTPSRTEVAVELIDINKSDFKTHQKEDPTLTNCWKKVSNVNNSKIPCFYQDKGFLFRLYRSSKLPSTHSWLDLHQLVVPTIFRTSLLDLAHSTESHLGVHKTYHRLAEDFFWPGMKRDVREFIKQCHHCQITGKPNETIKPVPLQPIPVPKAPFDKVIIDCVGPLPKSKKGYEYLLTILCPTTRYPLAIPIKNIHAKTIISQLLKVFTTYGYPKELQCDQGTNFTSNIFRQTMAEFGIRNVYATAYHPQTNGALERQHQTIKNLLRKYISETAKNWDEDLDLLMYILRSVPNESTGISSFELMFGRKPRTTLSMIKEDIVNKKIELTSNVSTYLNDLKEKLFNMYNFAFNNISDAQDKMKRLYDRKVKVRTFQPGERVLLYHPIAGAPLQERYMGPYEIIKRHGKVTYIINTPDRRKTTHIVHVNLLKPYYGPTRVINHLVSDNSNILHMNQPNEIIDFESSTEENPSSWTDCTNSEILNSLDLFFDKLEPSQKEDLISLLLSFPNICSDRPQHCSIISHDILLEPGVAPIRQPFYRIVGKKLEILHSEVKYLLDNNLAEPSTSPWASPCILVPKSNGQFRMCTDYRKINNVTVKDSYPLPRIADILDNIGQAKYLTQIDLLKGFYQVPLTRTAQDISSFITPFGLFSYRVMPFGLCNAPATFQRLMSEVIRNLDSTYVYLDDVVVATNTWTEHTDALAKLFQRLAMAHLTINLAKCSFGQGKVVYLGHSIGNGKIMPKFANTQSIMDFPIPTNRKQMKSFLGMVSYYSKFIKNFSVITAPLYSLTSPKVDFIWNRENDVIFNQLKSIMTSPPILQAPNLNKPFYLHVDASGTGFGGVLLQLHPSSLANVPPPLHHLFPVAYYSGFFKGAQIRWATIEKELYAIVASLQHFRPYLEGNHQVLVYTDHNPLIFLDRAKLKNNKLLRWSYILSAFNVKLQAIQGRQNVLADSLSRLPPPTSFE